jgi:hypothetical protein
MIGLFMLGGRTKSPVVDPLTGKVGALRPVGPNLTATEVDPVLINDTKLFWSLVLETIRASEVADAPTDTAVVEPIVRMVVAINLPFERCFILAH